MADHAGGSWGYRPHLDGLRAVAVYLVVGFHAGVGRLTGGFVGVDVFFVLSGYLVTNVLLQDLEGAPGRVRLGRFYARRARRLLPAAAVQLVVTAAVFTSIGSFLELADAEAAIRAAALYFANWHFIGQSQDYFAADVETSPVLHYWSLSVEEQFYLLWPLALGALWWVTRRAGGRQRTVVRVVVSMAALASVTAAVAISDTSLNRAYYGTDTRAYQLLAGALLALTPGLARRIARAPLRRVLPPVSVALLAGIGVTAVRLSRLDPVERGILTTVLVCGLLVTLEASTGGVARWLLSRRWLVYLGKVSYGTYLWHWLVILVIQRESDLVPTTTALVAAVIATGLASLSYQLIEHPIRTADWIDRWRTAPVAIGLAASVLVALVVAPGLLERPTSAGALETSAPAAGGSDRVPPVEVLQTAWADFYDYGSCEVSGPVACPIHDGGSTRALVVGESHAGMITPMLSEIAENQGLDLRAGYLSYCPWVRGIAYADAGPNCLRDQERLYEEVLPEFDPDIVFLAHRPIDDPVNPMRIKTADGEVLAGQSKEGGEALADAATDLVRSLRAEGRTVVVFEPVPLQPAGFDSLRCLTRSRNIDPCRYVATARPGLEEQALRELDESDRDVIGVDIDRLVCPYHPICDPVVGGKVVWRDDNHLTVGYATSLWPEVERHLVAEDVVS